MKVRKRDGSLQDFDIDKVKLTLERMSDELNRPFTGSDLSDIDQGNRGRSI